MKVPTKIEKHPQSTSTEKNQTASNTNTSNVLNVTTVTKTQTNSTQAFHSPRLTNKINNPSTLTNNGGQSQRDSQKLGLNNISSKLGQKIPLLSPQIEKSDEKLRKEGDSLVSNNNVKSLGASNNSLSTTSDVQKQSLLKSAAKKEVKSVIGNNQPLYQSASKPGSSSNNINYSTRTANSLQKPQTHLMKGNGIANQQASSLVKDDYMTKGSSQNGNKTLSHTSSITSQNPNQSHNLVQQQSSNLFQLAQDVTIQNLEGDYESDNQMITKQNSTFVTNQAKDLDLSNVQNEFHINKPVQQFNIGVDETSSKESSKDLYGLNQQKTLTTKTQIEKQKTLKSDVPNGKALLDKRAVEKQTNSKDVMKQISEIQIKSASQQEKISTSKTLQQQNNKQQISKQQQEQQQQYQSQNTNEDEDLMDDALNNSLELRESASFSQNNNLENRQNSKTQSNMTTDKSTPQTNTNNANSSNISQTQMHNNKQNTASPSKLNSKFQTISVTNPSTLNNQLQVVSQSHSQPQNSGSQSHRMSQLQGLGSKQQNIKQSVVQGKKTLTSLQINEKDQQVSDSGSVGKSSTITQLDLNLSLSNLSRVPIEQMSNQSLRSIDLRNNKINEEGLIPELFQLTNLWKLQLDNNQISQIPDQLHNMTGLRHLTLSQNQLSILPESLFQLKNLEKLDLSQNKFTNLQSQISQITSLKYLYLQGNQITSLPISLSSFKQTLQHLSIEWFMYISPFYEKLVKRNIPGIQSSIYNIVEDESLLGQILQAFSIKGQESSVASEQIDFIQFMRNLYGFKNEQKLITEFHINKQSNILHYICKYQHVHLFELLQEKYQPFIEINALDESGQSSLVIAMNEQTNTIVDKILRKFSDQLDLSQNQQIVLRHSDISSTNQSTKIQVLHPLMIAIRNLLYDTAKRILKIMINRHNKSVQISQQQKSKTIPSTGLLKLESAQSSILDLNLKDEHKNTLMHYIFANFSDNMALSVELCQELLKYLEIGQKYIPQNVTLKLNEVNKQGMTPFDLAIESKQNLAVEFAIYYNKNLLPPFQGISNTKTSKSKKETFDINFNQNHLGITPLHRAVVTRNHKAIYLLLASGICNTFKYDNEFKTARDLCLKIKYLYLYLKKGEMNQQRQVIGLALQQLIDENKARNLDYQNSQILSKNKNNIFSLVNYTGKTLTQLQKGLQHNNINFFQMSQRRGNRVKYNSWYTRVGANNGLIATNNMLQSSRQNTQERQKDTSDKIKLTGDNDDYSNDNSDEEDHHTQIKIEDVDDDNDQENVGDDELHLQDFNLKSSSYVQDSIVKGKLLLQQDRKANSILKPSEKMINLSERRLSDQNKSQAGTAGKLLGLKSSNVKHNQIKATNVSKPSTNSNQQQVQPQYKDKLSQMQNLKTIQDKRSRIQLQQSPDITQIDIATKNPLVNISGNQFHSFDKRTSFGKSQFVQEQSHNEEFNLVTEDDEINDEDKEEGVDSNHESPSTLPSNKYKHVMAVNNSKLARKPYYKQIQKNRFEREFCIIMDSKVTIIDRIQVLYYVFTQVQQMIQHKNKDIANSYYKDGRELLGFLKLELDNKEFNLLSLKNEILYFQEIMMNSQNLNIVLPVEESNQRSNPLQVSLIPQRQRKNTNNFSLERGPLPMIQETQNENTNVSPQKKLNIHFQNSSNEKPTINLKSQNNNLLQKLPQTIQENVIQEKEVIQSNSIAVTANSKLNKLRHNNSAKNLDQLLSQKSSTSQISVTKKLTSELIDDNDSTPSHKKQILNLKYVKSDQESSQKDLNKSSSSPRGNSGQIVSKLGQTSQTLNLQSPQASSTQIFQHSGNKKTKDSTVKKIEVQITDKNQMNNSTDKLSLKWKQLTINPNSSSVVSSQSQSISSQNSKYGNVSKIAQKQGSKMPITPQSQKNSTNLLNLVHSNNNTNQLQSQTFQVNGSSTQRQQQVPQTLSSSSTLKVQHNTAVLNTNKTPSSLSNRSNSNPRNSLIGQANYNLKSQAQKATQNSTTQGIGNGVLKSQTQTIQNNKASTLISNSNLSMSNNTQSSFNASNTSQTILSTNQQQQVQTNVNSSEKGSSSSQQNHIVSTATAISKLKTPSTKSGNYTRNTIGKTNPITKK
eukprot:403351997